MKYQGGFFLLLISLLATGPVAEASEKLLGLRTAVDLQGTTFTLRVPTPVKYTPSQVGPDLFVVDLVGVSSEMTSDSQPVKSPLVNSYRVFSYQGADNLPHTGMEISLKEMARVLPVETSEGLLIRVQPASAPAAIKQTSLREVSVVQPEENQGLEVEILADGELKYKVFQLKNPERLVVDLENTVNRIRQTRLEVNTHPIKTVRIAQFKRKPAVARVVMDLEGRVPFEIRRQPNGLTVLLQASADSMASNESAEPASIESEQTASIESEEPAARKIKSVEVKFSPAPEVEELTEELEEEPLLVASNSGVGVGTPSVPAAGPTADSTPWLAEPAEISLPVLMEPETVEYSESPALAVAVEPSAPMATEVAVVTETSVPIATEAAVVAEPSAPMATEPPMAAARPSGTFLMAQQSGAVPTTLANMPLDNPAAYSGERISLNLKNVDLQDFFRLMHEVSGLNIVLAPDMAGTVTLVLEEVPWDQAMDIVLKNNQLGKEVLGNVVRVARLSTLKAEKDDQRELELASEQVEPTQTVTRTLSYATANDLIAPLKRFLSPRGDLVSDPRTNTLILTDIDSSIQKVDQLIKDLDRKTAQVEIEARIVAASRQFARDIGSQLAASGLSGNVILGGTGQVGVSPIVRGTVPPLFVDEPPVPGGPDDPTPFANVSQPLAVNLGAVAPTSGFTFLLSGGRFALDSIITAAESRGLGKLLSRPKIITQNNVEANVEQGVRIPIQTNVNNTIAVQFVDVTLRLTVTPQITAEGTIFLKAEIENTTINQGIPRILGIPALNTQSATTQVLVSDGGTVFFGGIIQTENNLTEQQVPLLGSIPLIGNLFKRRSSESTTNELLFFITPKIVQS